MSFLEIYLKCMGMCIHIRKLQFVFIYQYVYFQTSLSGWLCTRWCWTCFWVLAPCRSWLVATVSEDHTASYHQGWSEEGQKIAGLYQDQVMENWPIKARDEEAIAIAMPRPVGRSLCGTESSLCVQDPMLMWGHLHQWDRLHNRRMHWGAPSRMLVGGKTVN
jgi:hypothetical protein